MKRGDKKKIGVFFVLAVCGLALVLAPAWAQQTKSGAVADTFEIKDPLFEKFTQSGVEFTHLKHSVDHKVDCAECHHVYEGKNNVWKEGDKVQKCSECHNSPVKNGADGLLSLKNAFHKQCQTCHKELKAGPTKCNECHPKAKKG